MEDGTDAVPPGYFGITTPDYWNNGGGRVPVNLSDLVGTKHHDDLHRLNGCCGLDGCDGPNVVCLQGHETEPRDRIVGAHAVVLLEDVDSHSAT